LPKAVAQIIADHAAEAMIAHGGILLTLADGKPTPLSTLFEQPPTLMRALCNNGWIVAGNSNRSMFFTRIINNGGPMDRIFSDAEKEVIGSWIDAGAQIPGDEKAIAAAEDLALDHELRATLSAETGPISNRHLIGMGAVH
jgi:hypothetical protein